MITTTMRDVELKVKTAMPKASEIQKLEHKALVSSIYIGAPRDSKLGTESRIQLDDAFARTTDIADWIQKERDSRNPADIPLLTTALKVHKDTRMGVVTDVKQELRRCSALKIMYSARKPAK